MPDSRQTSAITCQELAKQATEFLENRLPTAVNLDIWLHLEACPGCRAYLEQLALVRDTLRKTPAPEIPEATRKLLLKRLARMARDGGQTK